MIERTVESTEHQDDLKALQLRPKRLGDYIGQKKVIDPLEVFICAAKKDKKASTMSYYSDHRDSVKRR